MDSPAAAVTLVAVLAGTSLLGVAARRFHQPNPLPDLEGWARPRALPAGWCAGMAAGTWPAVSGGFSSIIVIGPLSVSVAVVALVLNVLVAGLMSLPDGWRPAVGRRGDRSEVGWT